ncbi:VWA domain-containing protein [Gammaproteobacteria bacterium AS21]
MLIDFFTSLRKAAIPVTITELLVLLKALEQNIVFANIDDFYSLARICLIKDEKYFDRYDQAFSHYFKGVDNFTLFSDADIPEDWLRAQFIKSLSAQEKEKIAALGGLDKLLDTFKQRLEEQKKRHAGGNKWIGTAGTSPFGCQGFNPEGIRIGGTSSQRSAVKVWEKRQFKNLDDNVELGTRNMKVALRKLRQFARTGSADELDLSDTIHSTAQNAGLLDIKMIPQRHNATKVLLFLDIGGSMDSYIHLCEQLFSAARSEFKHLEYFYFHNCIYEKLWKDNNRRLSETISTQDVINRYGSDYRVIFIGDAAMSPYELFSQFGSVEHMNEEPGDLWLQRIQDTWQKAIWLNPVIESHWQYTQTTQAIKQQFDGKMYPLTVAGLSDAINYLSK